MISSKEFKKEGCDEVEKIETIIDNGDLKLIDSLTESYSLKDRDALLKFGIAALLEGNNNEGLFTIKNTKNDDGTLKRIISRITPPEELLLKVK